MRSLITKDASFIWSGEDEEDFRQFKVLLTVECHLAYFDTKTEIRFYVDARPSDVEAILVQGNINHPEIVAYASRSLSPTEERYNQIEKEMFAATWTFEHFHI